MKLTFFRALILGILLVTLAVPAGELRAMAQAPQGQQPPPKKPPEPQDEYAISVDVPLVNVDVVVTDNRGNFISGLKKQNFRVLEDGVPQTVTNFAPTDAPIQVVLMIEFSKRFYSIYAYTAKYWAQEFLTNLNKDDWVALVSYDLKTHLEVDFTKNKYEVQRHLSQLSFPNFSEAVLFDAVVEYVDRLKDVKGKKAIVIVATGVDTGLGKNNLDKAMKALQQTDVTVFAVGVGRNWFEYLDARGAYDGAWGGAARMDVLQAQNQLNSFARATGGKAWFPRFDGELPGIFRDVAAHLRNQYSMGYVPSNTGRDGKLRKIKVELVGPDGSPLIVIDQNQKKVKYQVYAREGYLVPKGVS